MPQNLYDIDKIVLHHSASPRDTTTAAKIRGWHKDRGFIDIGYHYVVEASGHLAYGRALDSVPAAQKGANQNSIAICLVGDNTEPGEGWNDGQKQTARSLIVMLRQVIGRPLPICGHRDVAPSLCPGLDVKEVFPDLVSG